MTSTPPPAAWMILAARSVASIPFVRTQIVRTRGGNASTRSTDAFQVAPVGLAAAATLVDVHVAGGAVIVAIMAIAQALATRRRRIPAVKVIGLRQMAAGLVLAVATAAGTFA